MRVKDPVALALLITVLVGLLGSQWLFSRSRTIAGGAEAPPTFVVVVLAVGIAALYAGSFLERQLAESGTGKEESRAQHLILRLVNNGRSIALLTSLLLVLLLLRRLPQKGPLDFYDIEVVAWFGSILLYVLAIAEFKALGWDWQSAWKGRRILVFLTVTIMLLAFTLRVWRLESIPFTLGGEEAIQGLDAARVIEGTLKNPFASGLRGTSTMSLFYNSVTIRWFGQTITALRFPWALLGSATVFLAFMLAKRLLGTSVALVTAGLLSAFHYHIHFSRLGTTQIASPFFLLLALFILWRALDKGARLDWALVGVVAGLALYFNDRAFLTPIIIAVILVYMILGRPRQMWRRHRVGMAIALGALLVTGAPVIQDAIRFSNQLDVGIDQEAIVQNGRVNEVEDTTVESGLRQVVDRILQATLAFTHADNSGWYGLPRPLLGPLFGGLFYLGLAYGSLRLARRRVDEPMVTMVVWWWATILLAGLLNGDSPSSQHLVTLSVPVCFFIAFALWEVMRLAQKGGVSVIGYAFLGLAVVLFALSNLATYFLEYTPQRIYGERYAELATEIAPYVREMSRDQRIYFVGAPWANYWGIPTLTYLAPGVGAVDITEPIEEFLAAGKLKPGNDAAFIVIPQRSAELDALQEWFPEGKRRERFSPFDGRLVVTLFEVES